MSKVNNHKQASFYWEAESRYYEKKPPSYFRAIILLTVLITILLLFLKEGVLIFLVWVVFFVVYARAVVPPGKTKYKLDKFGLSYYGGRLGFEQISYFSLVKKNNDRVIIRLFSVPLATELSVVLPEEKALLEQVVNVFEDNVPFVDNPPKTEIEKIASFLSKVTGL